VLKNPVDVRVPVSLAQTKNTSKDFSSLVFLATDAFSISFEIYCGSSTAVASAKVLSIRSSYWYNVRVFF